MRWKGDDDAINLVLVLAPEHSWIMLCDHDKVVRHIFWANLALYRVGPSAHVVGCPLVAPNPRLPPSH